MPMRLFIYFVLVVVFGGGAYFYWIEKNKSHLLQEISQDKNESPTKGVLILSSNIELPVGTLIHGEDLTWIYPEGEIKSYELEKYYFKTLTDKNDLDNFVVRKQILSGQPILKGSLIKPGDSQYLSAVLTPGKRAVSVPIDPVTGNSGLIKPGNMVDVILTTNLEGDGLTGRELSGLMSKTILSGVRILAIDQKTENMTKFQPNEEIYGTATLETSAKQAELLTVARSMGTLSLSVRSAFEDVSSAIEDVSSKVVYTETHAGEIAQEFSIPIDSPDLILMHGVKRRNTSLLYSSPDNIAD